MERKKRGTLKRVGKGKPKMPRTSGRVYTYEEVAKRGAVVGNKREIIKAFLLCDFDNDLILEKCGRVLDLVNFLYKQNIFYKVCGDGYKRMSYSSIRTLVYETSKEARECLEMMKKEVKGFSTKGFKC